MGNLKGIVPCKMGAILSCYPALILKPQQGSPRVMLSCIPCPARQRVGGREACFPLYVFSWLPYHCCPQSLCKMGFGSSPPFYKANICIQAEEESQRPGPGPWSRPSSWPHVLCLSSHVSATSPFKTPFGGWGSASYCDWAMGF